MSKKQDEPSSGKILDYLTECFVETSKDLSAEELREDLRSAGSNPERVLGRVNALVTQTLASPPDRVRSGRLLWRPLAWGLAALLGVLLSVGTYQWVTLQRRLATKDQRIRQDQARIEQLHRTIDAMAQQSKPSAEPAATVDAVNKKAAALLKQTQLQAKTIRSLRRQLEKSGRPGPDVAVVASLLSRRGSDPGPTIVLSPAKRFLILQANISKTAGDYTTYKLVTKDRLGHVVAKDDRARKENDGFTLLLVKDVLKSGDYILDIYGSDPGPDQLLAQFPFRVRTPP